MNVEKKIDFKKVTEVIFFSETSKVKCWIDFDDVSNLRSYGITWRTQRQQIKRYLVMIQKRKRNP